MLKFKFLLLFFILSIVGFSQIKDPIEIDRPDQTECPFIVPKGMFQMENGFNFEKDNDNSNTFLLPTALWKLGINENLELRLITEFAIESTNDEKNAGIKPLFIGLKIKLCDEKGFVPKTSLIAHLMIPKLASEKLKTDFVAPKFRFTMKHTLSKIVNFSYNLGAEWDGKTAIPTYIYSFTTGYKLSDKIGAYTEIYGFITQTETPDHRCDGGFTYLINNDIIADISGGFGLTENAPKHYVSLGFSFRI